MTTNNDVELEIAQRLPGVLRQLGMLPRDYECEVHLHRGNRKKRSTAAFEGNWNPDEDSIRITFSQLEDAEGAEIEKPLVSAKRATAEAAENRIADLLRALDRAESRPGYDFVSLKWFRDTALPREGFSWAVDEAARYDVLQIAIGRELVRTKKVSNPRPPNYPVTAIYLNRSKPEVVDALGGQTAGFAGFRPVAMRGESLSSTVLHDRR